MKIFLGNRQHVSTICSKTSKIIGIICKARKYFCSKTLLTLYNTLFLPYLNYCNLIWASTYDSHIEPLLLLQKKGVRIITFSPPLTHTKPLFQKSNILPIHSIFKYQVSCFVFYHINKLLPPSLSSLFQFNFEYHNCLTRSRYDIHQHSLKYHFSIHFQAPTIWNNLLLSFWHSLTISNHKRKIKIFYIYMNKYLSKQD